MDEDVTRKRSKVQLGKIGNKKNFALKFVGRIKEELAENGINR